MPRPELLRDRRVVLGALVFIANEKADRGAGGLSLVHTRQDLDRIGLPPLRYMARAARLAPIEFLLNVGSSERHSRRTTVDHATVSGTVRLAERRDAVEKTEAIAGHGVPDFTSYCTLKKPRVWKTPAEKRLPRERRVRFSTKSNSSGLCSRISRSTGAAPSSSRPS